MKFTALSLLIFATTLVASAEDRPNILWLVSEDNSPYLGCYGDLQASTPRLDDFAKEGFRYRNAFSSAPVCSAARTTLITGVNASSLAGHNHRSKVKIPDQFEFYPEVLKRAGYYTTNNSKTDYNVYSDRVNPAKTWDQSSSKAHYKNRPNPEQPFFAVFNTTISHEGQTTDKNYLTREKEGLFPDKRVVAPEDVLLPPYHADTPEIRENWSRYYNNMWLMDQQIGGWLDELEASGQAENTIVFYYGDHGGALPRGKRNLHDSGTRVPLIIRIPEKYAHLRPKAAEVGGWVEQPVAFVDFASTVYSLLGIEAPALGEGVPFLGEHAFAGHQRKHVFLFRGRMDERFDTGRAIRTPDYLYIKNFAPHRPWGQWYSYPFRVMHSMWSWRNAFDAGETNPVQSRYWQEKPAEEFYVIADDPYQITNLIDAPEHANQIAILREKLTGEMLVNRDTGLIPEGMYPDLLEAAGVQTMVEFAEDEVLYPAAEVHDLATAATSRDPGVTDRLLEGLNHVHPVMRYWSTVGLLILGGEAGDVKAALMDRFENDPTPDVRIVAAEALGKHFGEAEKVSFEMTNLTYQGNEYEAMEAITVLENFAREGHLSWEDVREMVPTPPEGEVTRIFEWIMNPEEPEVKE